MRFKQLFTDDDSAVSPVIGVILMVAITVILAAVIATFVLGLGEQVSDTTPNANFQAESPDNSFELDAADGADDEDTVDDGIIAEFTHTSGPAIEADNLRLGSLSEQDIQESVDDALDDAIEEYDTGDDNFVKVTTEVEGLDDGEISASDTVGLNMTLEIEGDFSGDEEDIVEEIILEDEDVTLIWETGSDSAVLRTFTINEITLEVENTQAAT